MRSLIVRFRDQTRQEGNLLIGPDVKVPPVSRESEVAAEDEERQPRAQTHPVDLVRRAPEPAVAQEKPQTGRREAEKDFHLAPDAANPPAVEASVKGGAGVFEIGHEEPHDA